LNVLGISCLYHDSAAVLIRDGVLVAASQEERFSRRKHDSAFPDRAIRFCLESGGLSLKDVDLVAFYERPLLKLSRTWSILARNFPHSHSIAREVLSATGNTQLSVRRIIREKLGVDSKQIVFVPHHLSHASSAFLCSPFDDSAIVTIDGVGEWTTTTIGHGTVDASGLASLSVRDEIDFPHSIGLMYSAFTQFCGFEVNEGEYKLMGLSAYGTPRFTDKVREVINVAHDGSFRLQLDYFSFLSSRKRTYSEKFVELFGAPNPDKEGDIPQHYADIAASVQRVTEETILAIAREAHERTGSRNLCMAGGVALNSVANGRISREGPFEHIFVQPAADDSGGALGAALYASLVLNPRPRTFTMEHAYWGAGFSDEQVKRDLRRAGRAPSVATDEGALADEIADLLADGKVIGFMQGRAEWGPRALGARSIIADPRRAVMKDTINSMVKFREPFRPFAPAVLAERASEYFDFDPAVDDRTARFMLTVHPFTAGKGSEMEAANHCGTGRLQLVDEVAQPRYRRAIEAFEARTSVPAIVNTSFNVRGEPVVNSVEDALRTFMNSGIDCLVAGNAIVKKSAHRSKYTPGAALEDVAVGGTDNAGPEGADPTLERAYALAPQLRDYHAIDKAFRPYTSIGPIPSYASGSVNTDVAGYRYSHVAARAHDWRDWRNASRRGLLIGGSTAFGQGATSDAQTIASHLNELGDVEFLNLGIPGGTSGQEAVASLPHLGDAEVAFIVSGVNTLYTVVRFGDHRHLPYTPLLMAGLASNLSRVPIDLVYRRANGKTTQPLRRTPAPPEPSPCSSEAAMEVALKHQKRDLVTIQRVAGPECRVVFCIQPLSLRAKTELTDEEDALHDLLIRTKEKVDETLTELVTLWPEYKSRLAQMCRDLGVEAVDLEDVDYDGWCFLDHVHLTDTGNLRVAQHLRQTIG